MSGCKYAVISGVGIATFCVIVVLMIMSMPDTYLLPSQAQMDIPSYAAHKIAVDNITNNQFCYSFGKYNQSVAKSADYNQFMKKTFRDMFPTVNTLMRQQVSTPGPNHHFLNYLSNYRNPCWAAKLPTPDTYSPSIWNTAKWSSKSQSKCARIEQIKVGRSIKRRRSKKSGSMVRCFPYVLLLGMFKAGTTDFYRSLAIHADLIDNCV